MSKQFGVAVLATEMLSDLKRRFKFVEDVHSAYFDPLYISSTFLSLPYRGLLNKTQEKVAKVYLIEEMKEANGGDKEIGEDENRSIEETEDPDRNFDQPPPAKCFKHLSRVSALLYEQERQKDTANNQGEITVVELELVNYTTYHLYNIPTNKRKT